MDVERRSVLNGIALTSLAGVTLNSPVLALANAMPGDQAQPTRPLLTLISGTVERSGFLQGIAAAPQGKIVEVQRTDLSVGFVQAFNQWLRSEWPIRVIGLVDDASGAFIVQLARSAGARLQWLGQHSTDGGHSRHRVLSTEAADCCSAQLGQQLRSCGTPYRLDEQRINSAKLHWELPAQLQERAAIEASQWPATLGFALASVGSSQAASAPLVDADTLPLLGSFVSFSIES
ncbi:hypothetical protein [Hyphomicrobium sp. 99]|uniref:hypothetical protein n=1 Tax=Hyphomicrobium sp. 99 TaxID=1163419 RepID=UPI0005F84932|nr:hypothetical protein [Hyphomicrobium sp. 99]